MDKYSHAQPLDPNQARTCRDCCAKQTLSNFGLAKYSADGRSHICHSCRSQYLRLKRKAKYNNSSNVDQEVIRSVRLQNERILQLALAQTTFQCIGFVPHTDRVYRVHFGKSRYDFPSMAVFNENGSQYFEVAFSGLEASSVMAKLMDALKSDGIRLELSDADMIAAKTTIYYL